MSFKNLNLINPIIRAVTEAGFSKPTEIQHTAIPHILTGRDILGIAQAGAGKTAAFVMSVLQLLKKNTPDHKEVRILILTPTRELAVEIEEKFIVYSKYLPLSKLSITDGVSIGSQLSALRTRVDTLIATPGRLLELIDQRHIDLSKVEILILDQADKMLDLKCINEVKKIIRLTSQKKQTLFFSETMPKEIRKTADTLLYNPVVINITSALSVQTIRKSIYPLKKSPKNETEETVASFGEEEHSDLNNSQKTAGFTIPDTQNKTFLYIN